ncbi:MAG: hypothetical protein EBE86_000285 [Hormoscilla sp. GUM202]|nr:hypothetical protein [Hormoscilla sp. GUM202]
MTCDRSPAWVQRPTTTVKASIEELLAIFGEIFSRTMGKKIKSKARLASANSINNFMGINISTFKQ